MRNPCMGLLIKYLSRYMQGTFLHIYNLIYISLSFLFAYLVFAYLVADR